MPIEISNPTLSLVKGTSESSSARPGGKIDTSNSTAVPAQDTVAITNTADMLRNLEQRLSSIPVVDLQRVSQVRSIVGQTQDSNNFRQMAEKIMRFESDLNRARA